MVEASRASGKDFLVCASLGRNGGAMGIGLTVWVSSTVLAAGVAVGQSGIEGARLVHRLPLKGTVYHVQGLDLDAEHVWVTSVDKDGHKGYLHEFDRKSGVLVRQVDLTDGPRFHAGGIQAVRDSIWVPVAEYRAHSSAVIEEIDKETLKVKRKIAVADHLGCVAWTGSELVAGNWDARQLYVLKPTGEVVRVMDNPSTDNFQDLKFGDGMLVGSGVLSKTSGAVEWYRWPSMELVRRVKTGVTDKGRVFTEEGMAVKGRDLFLVPEDGPTRLFWWRLGEAGGKAKADSLAR
jgi:hypothetical protein